MKLIDNFYKIHSLVMSSSGNITGDLELMDEHPIYDGHFPNQPVVPGVCTLTIIKECLGKLLNRNIVFKNIKECKYTSVIIPKKNLHIGLDFIYNEDSKSLKGNIIIIDSQQVALKLKATIE